MLNAAMRVLSLNEIGDTLAAILAGDLQRQA